MKKIVLTRSESYVRDLMEEGVDKALPGQSKVILRDHPESDGVRHYESQVAKRSPTRDEVKAQLDSKSAEISARIESIQHDVLESGQKVKSLISDSPLIPIAGTLLAGLAVGLIFGGSRDVNAQKTIASSDLSELLVQKVKEADAAGQDPVAAVSKSIGRLVPAETSAKKRTSGVISAVGGLLVNLAVRQAITYIEGRSSQGATGSEPAQED